MKPRMNAFTAAPDAMNAMLAFEDSVRNFDLEPSLFELVKIRASQLNGCAFCVHMHTRDARAAGEREERIFLLSAWQESPLYTERERAALAWTEALTLLPATHAPDDVYELARRHFSEEELVQLTLLIGAINVWNRVAVGFRSIHPMEKAAQQAIAS